MTFFPKIPSSDENCEEESNPMPSPVYLYFSRSAFSVNFTDANNQLPNVKSVFTFFNSGPSM